MPFMPSTSQGATGTVRPQPNCQKVISQESLENPKNHNRAANERNRAEWTENFIANKISRRAGSNESLNENGALQ